MQAELEGPKFPDALDYLWRVFVRLASRRGSNGFGPSPIGWGEIDAFCHLTGTRLSPWEVEFIEALDDLWMAEASNSIKKRQEKPSTKPPKVVLLEVD